MNENRDSKTYEEVVLLKGSLQKHNLENEYKCEYISLKIYMYMNIIFYTGLQTVIQLIQQWLSTSRKSKNPGVVWLTKLDTSAGL